MKPDAADAVGGFAPDETKLRDRMTARQRIRRDTRPVPGPVLVSVILAAMFFAAVAFGLSLMVIHRFRFSRDAAL